MRTNELIKLLRKHGVKLEEHGAKHDMYFSPITGRSFPVPRHKTEIPIGTLNKILKDAGLK